MEQETTIATTDGALTDVKRGPGRPKRTYEPMEQERSGMMEIPHCEPHETPEAVSTTVDVVTDIRDPVIEYEKFLAEVVEVYIHPSSEKNADRVFTISVNGKSEVFFRGHKKKIARRFVFGLATARQTSYANEEFTNHMGDRDYRWPTYTGLRYPFSVINDTPKGVDWLDQVMKSPG